MGTSVRIGMDNGLRIMCYGGQALVQDIINGTVIDEAWLLRIAARMECSRL